MKIIGFYIGFAFIWLFTLLPMRVLYLISDLFYLIVYYIIGYRRKVVKDNLRHAFPEKSEVETDELSKRFFRHFCDIMVETAKTIHLSQDEIQRRVKYINPEILYPYFEKGQSIVLVSGHYGNWEWMSNTPAVLKHHALAIYKPLRNEKFNKLVLKMRNRYSSRVQLVPMNEVFRVIIQYLQQKQVILTWFLADQSPPRNYPFRISFLNREVPFFNGFEKVARKFGHPVFYAQINKKSRGYYQVEFELLCDDPSSTVENEITRKVVEVIENTIRQQPEYWLWSHRRWKHAKETPR